MNTPPKLTLIVTAAVILITLFCGCSRKNEISPATEQRIEELVQEFANDLEGWIIPAKGAPDKLEELNLTVSRTDATYNINLVEGFYNLHKEYRNSSVTIVFSKTSFVVTRIIFEAGYGYYLRYQLDPEETGPLPVSVRMIDDVEFIMDDDTGNAEISLIKDEERIATLSFKNIQ